MTRSEELAQTSGRPPGVRPLVVAVLVAVAAGLAVALATLLHLGELTAVLARVPGQTRSSASSTLWSRIGVAGGAAVIWPLLLRRLMRGRVRVLARMRRVAVIAAAAIVATALLTPEPAWLRVLQAVQTAALLGVFATTLRPQLRSWYAAHRPAPPCPGAWRAVLLLVVLSPLIAEVSIGNLPFSTTGLKAAAFTVPIYCAGVLLVRETAVRTGGGWPAVLLMGGAYCLVEEGVGLQSLFSPTLYHAARSGVRVAGVNWGFAALQSVNHAVWSIAVPIALAGLAVPASRGRRLLERPALVLTGVVYVMGVGLMVLIHLVSDPHFFASPVLLAGAAVLAALLVVAAVRWPSPAARRAGRPGGAGAGDRAGHAAPPRPAVAGAVGFAASACFLALLVVPGRVAPDRVRGAGGLLLLLAAVAVAVAAGWCAARWSVHPSWGDAHLLALCGGAIVGHTLVWGAVLPTTWATRGGVAGLLVLTLVALAALHRRVEERRAAPDARAPQDARRAPAAPAPAPDRRPRRSGTFPAPHLRGR
jgi:hypothetical protein